MAHPRWLAGKLSTGFIAEEFPAGFHAHAPEGELAEVLAAVAAAIDHVLGERKRSITGQLSGRSVNVKANVRSGLASVRLSLKSDARMTSSMCASTGRRAAAENCAPTGSRAI